MSTPLTGDVIEETIQIRADQALEALAALDKEGRTFQATIKALAETIVATSKEMGISLDTVSAKFKNIFATPKGGTSIFGDLGDAAGWKEVNNEVKDLAAGEESAAASSLHLMTAQQLLNTVMGTFVAMGVFQVMQAISTGFNDAIKYAGEYYQALLNITVAQNTLAQGGINVTNQQLIDMAGELHDKFQTFAKVDMLTAVSNASLLTSNLHLSVDQIQQLVEMASTLARLHGGLPADYVDHLLKAASGTNALWANQMGIAATSADILAKAKELGLVQADAKKIDDDRVKAIAGLAVEWDKLHGQETKALEDNNSLLAQGQKNASSWKDSLTAIGTTLSPMWTAIKTEGSGALSIIASLIGLINREIIDLESTLSALWVVQKEVMDGQIRSLQQLSDVANLAKQSIASQLLSQQQTGNIGLGNTPVSPTSPSASTTPDAAAKASDLNSVMNAYQTYYDGMAKDKQNFDNRMQDMQDAYNLRVQNEEQNTNLRIANEKQNFHLKQLEAEQNFQNKMKDLTSRYQMDLEDALRKRDAEAVIKIMERYQNETDTAKRSEQLRQTQEAEQEKLKISQMKAEEQLRLKQMASEFELQQAQERRNYAQQQADLAKSLDQKLQEEAVKLADKYNLNQNAANDLYSLFKEYYGPDGKMASTQESGYLAMEQNTANMIAQMQVYIGQYSGIMAAASSGWTMFGAGQPVSGFGTFGEGAQGGYSGGAASPPSYLGGSSSKKFAQGGVDVAQQATTVTYGEAGPEMAIFLPLNAAPSSIPVGSGAGGGSALGGKVQIEVTMDPDLQAQIVNNTLTEAAISIERVNRSRV